MKILVLNPPSKIAKNVVRDLIYGCWCKGKRIGGTTFPPLNLLYVATVLQSKGEEVKLLDAPGEGRTIPEIKGVIGDYDVVIISTSTMTFNEDAQVLAELKEENNRLITIVFGSHPTFMPHYSLAKESVDIIVRGEPEYIIRDVISSLRRGNSSWNRVKGIGFKEGDDIINNQPYPYMKNLDELPFPDRNMLPRRVYYFNPVVKRLPYTTVMTSRGCPGRCNFCTVPSFYGRKIRYRSAESVVEELVLISNQGYKEVFFRDETFSFCRERNIKLCREMIKRNIDLSWVCNARIGTLDKEMMRLMKMAGCHMIKFGVESGVQEILENIKKEIKVEETRQTLKWAHELNLDTHAHMMLGAPGETKETIQRTIEFVKEIDPTTVTFGICTPYPGTELFSKVTESHPEIKDGSQCDLKILHTKGFFNRVFAKVDGPELERSIYKAYRMFYLRPSYLLRWLFKIKSFEELRRVFLAGFKVIDFSLWGE